VNPATDTLETRRPTFLVVDDDPIVRRLVASGLRALKPETVIEVEDGLQAQKALREHRIDVVLTDMLMPNMDGRELMQWAQTHCTGPLWIVLSGLDTFDAALDAMHLGAFDFLPKPPVVHRVRVAVRNALDQIRLVGEREQLYQELEHRNGLLDEKVKQLESLCQMLQDQADVIHGDLARAEVIQRALLPRAPPKLDGWSTQTLYRTGNNVGGDFYDIVPMGKHHVGLVVADAAGHGVAAAMLSVLFKHRLRMWDEDKRRPLTPRVVLGDLNRDLRAHICGPGIFVTAIYGLLNTESGRLRLASAGHPPAILNRASGGTVRLERSGPALGLQGDASYGESEVEINPGDRLLLFTDGLVESSASAPRYDDLEQALTTVGDARDLLQSLYGAASTNVSADRDDVTIFLLERVAGDSYFDDVSESKEREHGAEPSPVEVEVTQCAESGNGFLSVAGKGTWVRSQAFYEAAVTLLDHNDSLTMDFGACEYLDSTFLGTVHEVVTLKPNAVQLQRVAPQVQGLFEELSMQAVLEHISDNIKPLPETMTPLEQSNQDQRHQAQRVLRAHEILTSLSEHNREQFLDVVKSLRQELGEPHVH